MSEVFLQPRSYSDFLVNYGAQDAGVSRQLTPRGMRWLGAGLHMGELLRVGKSLTQRTLSGPADDVDTLSLLYSRIINSTLGEGDRADVTLPAGQSSVSACKKAEGRFADWLVGLEAGTPVGGRIFVDPEHEPVILQKSTAAGSRHYGSTSGLLLRDATLTGKDNEVHVSIPAGSLVGLRVENEGWYITMARPGPTEVVPTSRLLGVAFLRPSGFSLSPAEWTVYMGSKQQTEVMQLDNAYRVGTLALRRASGVLA